MSYYAVNNTTPSESKHPKMCIEVSKRPGLISGILWYCNFVKIEWIKFIPEEKKNEG